MRPLVPARSLSSSLVCLLALSAACASRARPPTADARRPVQPPPVAAPEPEPEPAPFVAPPLFYGLVQVAEHRPGGPALLVAGNLRVAVAADGAVTVAAESPSSFITAQRPLGNGAWAFFTSDEQVLVAGSFTGPFTATDDLPRSTLARATGAVAAVRLSDGQWRAELDEDSATLDALGDAAWGLHFIDAQRAVALRAPGEAVLSRDGGAHWEPLPLAGDIPLDLQIAPDGSPIVVGARHRYRLTGDALVATTEAPAPPDPVAPSDDAIARWNDWWRTHLWPRGAPSFWLTHDGVRAQAREHRDALYWTTPGAIERLRRDGTHERLVIPYDAPCTHSPFGAKLLLRCHNRAAAQASALYTLDPAAFTLTPFPATLNGRTRVNPSPDGRAVILDDPDSDAPRRAVWTETRPTWRYVALPSSELAVDTYAGKAIAFENAVAYAVSLDDPAAAPVRLVGRSDGPASGRVWRVMAASVRGDGGFAILTEVENGDNRCALYLGADAGSLVRTEVEECHDVDALLFADARFGVRVESAQTWVTRDGGAHWTSISRPLGVPFHRWEQELRGLRPSLLHPDGIAVSPSRFLPRAPDAFEGHENLWRTSDLNDDEPEVDDHVDAAPHHCTPFGAPRARPPERTTPQTRSFALWHQGTRVEVALQRTGDTSVRARIGWAGGPSTRGTFAGDAPWRDAPADFDRPATVGYALRGAGAGGVLLERCVGARGADAFVPNACDVRWLAPDGTATPLVLQQAPDETAGAWMERAAADGAGWVVELASTRASGWTQWQHWAADHTLTRWGDLRRDRTMTPYVALARVNHVWGTIEGGDRGSLPSRAFAPHGGARGAPFEYMPALRFCASAATAEEDLWFHEGVAPMTLPMVPGVSFVRTTLATDPTDGGWCVSRVDSANDPRRWASADPALRRPSTTAWLVADGSARGGHGASVRVVADGRTVERSLRCEVIREPNADVGEEPFSED